jgi:hypothetical protein
VDDDMSESENLGSVIHGLVCDSAQTSRGCRRYTEGSLHHEYYESKAKEIFAGLEPEIGADEVMLAVRVVLGAIL